MEDKEFKEKIITALEDGIDNTLMLLCDNSIGALGTMLVEDMETACVLIDRLKTGWIPVQDAKPTQGSQIEIKGYPSDPKIEGEIISEIGYYEEVGFIDNITHWRYCDE